MAGTRNSLGPRGFLSEEEKQNEEAMAFWQSQGFKPNTDDRNRILFTRDI